MAKLLHKHDDAPHHGDHGGSLNRAVRDEVPALTVPVNELEIR